MKSFFGLVAVLFTFSSFGQILNPVKWSWKAVPAGKDEYKLQFIATIDKGYHTYSQFQGNDGAVPTSFTYEPNKNVTLVGKSTETCAKTHEGIDDVFGVFQKSFEEKVVFEQLVKISEPTTLKGSFEFMVCDNKTCLPPTSKAFSFDLTLADGEGIKKKLIDTVDNVVIEPVDTTPASSLNSAVSKLTSYYQHFFDKEKFGTAISDCGTKEEPITTWLAFILGFGGGLLALLTPCVFPMIPLTVSFFTKRNEDKAKGKFESVFYGFSILLIFVLLSMPFLIFNLSPNTLNAVATNIWVNLLFFVIFIVFAFSFFGYYEIALPHTLANKVDSASNLGGLVGIFFMALTLVVVSFSCTGPILGTLLGSMATAPNGKLNLVVGMSAFGFAMGLPFTLFAFFPNLLKSLPKSGSWMDALKVVLGFVELILALKFLSNADLVGHWGIIKRELFLIIWFILGAAVVLYLTGVLKMKGNENVNRKSPIRLFFAAVFFVFTAYCGYGLLGNDLKQFSGFLPPNYYSWFEKKTQCPNNLSCFKDYDEALAYAKQQNKPLLVDFTGYNCANCRRMEEKIWTDPEVFKLINEKYVLVSLYVDDYEKKLPDSLQYVSPFNGEKRTSYGHKWSDFQTVCFNTNTQPQYVLVSPDEKLLNTPWNGYDANPDKYQAFLECGLSANKLK
jgi:thiol:disulfide interchange protein DsbD